jgi:N utilization substance protein A
LLRIVDAIGREKRIEKEVVFDDLEAAMISAMRKAYGATEEVEVHIDRMTGDISATRNGVPLEMRELGRIAAQTAKQVMIQKIREAERSSIHDEYIDRKGQVISGVVGRVEGGTLVINLGRAEAILPRSEQIPGEAHQVGDRVRAMIVDVREQGSQVRIILSRSHPEFIRRLFELEVPEVAERVIEIRALSREAGYRTKIAVSSIDSRVDAVGACVGVRGSRIKNIVDELGGEKIDIVRWNESSQILIANALRPAEVQEIALCFELNKATVVVADEQLSLAIGKRGQNVRLAARLTGWDVDILTPADYNKGLDDMEQALRDIPGVDDSVLDKLVVMGFVNLNDLATAGKEPLVQTVEMDEPLAEQIITKAAEVAPEKTGRTAAPEPANQVEQAEQGESSAESALESGPAGEEGSAEQQEQAEEQEQIGAEQGPEPSAEASEQADVEESERIEDRKPEGPSDEASQSGPAIPPGGEGSAPAGRAADET